MKIAVFGGSFDPPHIGHEILVKEALKTLDIDKLIIMPTFLNPFKNASFHSPQQRLKWAYMLWGNEEKIHISDFEIRQKRPVRSHESISYLKEKYKPCKIYLIIGADNLKTLNLWENFDKLSSMVEFIIATRGNEKIENNLKKLQVCVNISSSILRENLQLDFIPKKLRQEFKQRKIMQEKIEQIVKFLDDKKCENIQFYDMEDKEYMADGVIIATTLNSRHSFSCMEDLQVFIKSLGEEVLHLDSSGEWVVLDLGDLLIHLLSQEYRTRYNIEEFLNEFEKNKSSFIKDEKSCE